MTAVRIKRIALLPAASLLLAVAPSPALGQRISELQVAPPYVRMVPDAQVQLLATAYDSDGNPIATRISWTSSNINVVRVEDDGSLRAIAPGTAVVTAAASSGGRTSYGRTVVTVVRPGAETQPTPAVPAPPGAAPPAMTPSVPPPVRMRLDSTALRHINCEEPFISSINPVRACYDERPMIRHERPAGLAADASMCPTPMLHPARFLVHVSEGGTVTEVRHFVETPCQEFNRQAMAVVRRLSYSPARREGRPVAAWTMVIIRPDHGPSRVRRRDPNTVRP